MASYVFDEFGYFKEVFEDYLNGIEVKHPRSVDFAPAFIPDYPRENGKPWFKLDVHMTKWVLEVYQAPPEEIKAKNVVSKTDFMDLFGFPKLIEIQTVAQTDIEVKTAWEYGLAFNEIVVDHPKTLALLALLGTKQIGEKPILTVEEIDKISHNQQIW